MDRLRNSSRFVLEENADGEYASVLEISIHINVADDLIVFSSVVSAPLTFQYVNPRRTFTFRAVSEDEKNKFKDAVTNTVKVLISGNPVLARPCPMIFNFSLSASSLC